jgi:hypothetical protein
MQRKSPSTELVASHASAAADAESSVVVPDAGATIVRSPTEWAEVYFPASGTGRDHPELWRSASASQLNGWAAYEARTGKRVKLTAADYRGAVNSVNDFKPHAPADHRSRS